MESSIAPLGCVFDINTLRDNNGEGENLVRVRYSLHLILFLRDLYVATVLLLRRDVERRCEP